MNRSQEHIDQVKRLIDREILCCQSYLVDALLQNACTDSEQRTIIDWNDIINFRVNTEEEAKELGYDSLEAMENSDGTEKEVFEWWLVTKWMADKIEELGGVIVKAAYGTWWGRTETGQSLTMDSDINGLADYLIKL